MRVRAAAVGGSPVRTDVSTKATISPATVTMPSNHPRTNIAETFAGRLVAKRNMMASSGAALSKIAIAEGWHRGPTATPLEDPTKIGAVVDELMRTARKNAGMDGQDLD